MIHFPRALFLLSLAISSAAGAAGAKIPELVQDIPDLPALPDGEVVAIFAHADDEILSLAALAELHRHEPGRRVRWVMVSDSSGWVVPHSCDGMTNSDCRAREATEVARCMGIDPPEFMGRETGIKDGMPGQIPDLAERIEQYVTARSQGPIAAIYTHDPRGLYGHPDHIAVHRAVRKYWETFPTRPSLVRQAVPKALQKTIVPRREAWRIPFLPITNKVDLSEDMQRRLACAASAHRSQSWLIRMFMGLKSPAEFFARVPRQFFNVE